MALIINNVGGYNSTATTFTVGDSSGVSGVQVRQAAISGEKMLVRVVNGVAVEVVRGIRDNADLLEDGEELLLLSPDVTHFDDFETDSSADYTKSINGTGTITIDDSNDGRMVHKHTAGSNGQCAWHSAAQLSEDWEILQIDAIQHETAPAGYQSFMGFSADAVAAGYIDQARVAGGGLDDAYLVDMSPATDFGPDHLNRYLAGVKLQLDTKTMKISGPHSAHIFLVKTDTAIKVFTFRPDVLRMEYVDSSADRHTGAMWAGLGAGHTNGATHIYFAEMTINQWNPSGGGGGGGGAVANANASLSLGLSLGIGIGV